MRRCEIVVKLTFVLVLGVVFWESEDPGSIGDGAGLGTGDNHRGDGATPPRVALNAAPPAIGTPPPPPQPQPQPQPPSPRPLSRAGGVRGTGGGRGPLPLPQPPNQWASEIDPKVLLDPSAGQGHWEASHQAAHTASSSLPDVDYCRSREHFAGRDFLGCGQRNLIKVGRLLGTGKSKSVFIAEDSRGGRIAFKSATAKGGGKVRQNPIAKRIGVMRLEYNKSIWMQGTYGLPNIYGACFTASEGWIASPLAERGTFGPATLSGLKEEDALKLALSAARMFGCLSMHRFGFAFLSDNKPEQFLVRQDWSLELGDLDGLRFYTPGSRGRMGEKPCKSDLDCVANRKRPTFTLSPDNTCEIAAGKCRGEDSRSMVYVLGQMFLSPLSRHAPALKSMAEECTNRTKGGRPDALDVARRISTLLGPGSRT